MYDEISEAEIDAGTSSTLRAITGRRVKYILSKVRNMLSPLIQFANGKVGINKMPENGDLDVAGDIYSRGSQVMAQRIAFGVSSDSTGVPDINASTRVWRIEDYDFGDCFASSTFTATVDGVYHFDSCSAFVAGPERCKACLFVNGNFYASGNYWDVNGIAAGQDGGPIAGNISRDILLAAGDTVTAGTSIDDAAAFTGNTYENYFTGHLVFSTQ
jgi:hypothetical protein